ncbi:O-antigen ligase [Aquimarina sp. AU58]|uniref:O-antigen ligase family protein n=1 Tax=Aquimarina sp. AU58 TaxID=1874112 RepID=UPI000D6E1F30|nr:O-antigen ligase family protein [Aquimarina sp. AU58]
MKISGLYTNSKKYKNILEKVTPVLLALLPIVVTFFGEKLVPVAIVVLVVSFLFEENKKENFAANKKLLLPYVIYVSVFILYSFFAIEVKLAMKVLERQVSLLLIPAIVFSSNLNTDRVKIFVKTFIIGMLIILIYSVIKLSWFIYTQAEWIEIMNKTSGNSTYLQFKYPHIVGAHPTYWCYLLILANIFLLSNSFMKIFSNKYWNILLLIIFNINIFFLSARTPIVVNILIHLLAFILYQKNQKMSFVKIIGIIGAVFLIGILAINSPLLKAKVLGVVNDERMYLWPKALDQIKQNYFVLGEGLGQGKKILKDYVIQNGDPREEYIRYDLHNQYLKHYLDMGIMGLISLLYLLIHPFFRLKNLFSIMSLPLIGFCTLFMLSLFTESSLYLIKGILIFAIFSSILLKDYQNQQKNIE